jgi:hypothetical protein
LDGIKKLFQKYQNSIQYKNIKELLSSVRKRIKAKLNWKMSTDGLEECGRHISLAILNSVM